jgi:outer membrane protein TolC
MKFKQGFPFLLTATLLAGNAQTSVLAQSTRENTIATPRPLDPSTNSTNPSTSATQAQNPFLGSVTIVPLQPGVRMISLDDAVKFALRANLGLIDSTQASNTARAERMAALSQLLPHLDAMATEHYVETGSAETSSGLKTGLRHTIGPFNYEAMHLELTQNALDMHSFYRLRSAKSENEAMRKTEFDSRNIVVLAAASSYIAIEASQSRVRVDEAELESAKAVETLMRDRVERGVSPRIEWIRAQVAERTAQQRLDLAKVQLQKDKFALTRVIGLPIEQEFDLTTPLSYQGAPEIDQNSLLEKARTNRNDLKAAQAMKESATAGVKSEQARRLPSINIDAQYGTAGVTPAHLYSNFNVSGTLRVPLFTGGEIASEVHKAKSTEIRRDAEYEDLENRVRFDVRSAYLDVESAERSVSVASQNLDLAKEGMKEAKDRFDVGVSNFVDLLEGQQQLAEAEDNYISSVYAHNLAKLMLIRSTGTAEKELSLYVGEK